MSDSNGESDYKASAMEMRPGNGAPLGKTDTIGSISLTPEQFDRLYLSPQNKVSGDLRRTFGNPTPVGLGGFILALTPLVMQFMGWWGTEAANGLPTFGSYIFMGGLLAILASIGEFIIGNTFPSVFFGVYGSFFLTYGVTLIPMYGAVTSFADPTAITSEMNEVQAMGAAYMSGAASPQFNAAIAFLSSFMAVFTFIMLVASVRTNVFFVLSFLSLTIAFALFAVSRFKAAGGDAEAELYYQVGAGASGFVTCMCGWYLLFAEVLVCVDFPIAIPVFDLSGLVPGKTQKMQQKKDAERGMQRYE